MLCGGDIGGLFGGEFVDAGLVVFFSGIEADGWECGLVGCIGPFLGFEGDGFSVFESVAAFAFSFSVEEIAAIELDTGLVGENFHQPSGGGFVDGGSELHSRSVSAQHPVVVVAIAVVQLQVVVVDALTDSGRLIEIEWRACHSHQFTGGDKQTVDRGDGVGADGEDVVVDGAAAFPFQVEETVMREVDHCGAVGGGTICDFEFVVSRKGIGHGDFQIAGVSFSAVRRNIRELNPIRGDRVHVPHHLVESLETSVQTLPIVVDRHLVGGGIDGEFAIGNTVSHTAHHATDKAFALIVDIFLERVVTQHHVSHIAISVGHPKRHHVSSKVGYLHGDARRRGEGVERHGFAIDSGFKIFGIHQFHAIGAASREQGNCQKGKSNLFHRYSKY